MNRGLEVEGRVLHDPVRYAIYDIRGTRALRNRFAGRAVEFLVAAALVDNDKVDSTRRIDHVCDPDTAAYAHLPLQCRVFRAPQATGHATWWTERVGKCR